MLKIEKLFQEPEVWRFNASVMDLDLDNFADSPNPCTVGTFHMGHHDRSALLKGVRNINPSSLAFAKLLHAEASFIKQDYVLGE